MRLLRAREDLSCRSLAVSCATVGAIIEFTDESEDYHVFRNSTPFYTTVGQELGLQKLISIIRFAQTKIGKIERQ